MINVYWLLYGLYRSLFSLTLIELIVGEICQLTILESL